MNNTLLRSFLLHFILFIFSYSLFSQTEEKNVWQQRGLQVDLGFNLTKDQRNFENEIFNHLDVTPQHIDNFFETIPIFADSGSFAFKNQQIFHDSLAWTEKPDGYLDGFFSLGINYYRPLDHPYLKEERLSIQFAIRDRRFGTVTNKTLFWEREDTITALNDTSFIYYLNNLYDVRQTLEYKSVNFMAGISYYLESKNFDIFNLYGGMGLQIGLPLISKVKYTHEGFIGNSLSSRNEWYGDPFSFNNLPSVRTGPFGPPIKTIIKQSKVFDLNAYASLGGRMHFGNKKFYNWSLFVEVSPRINYSFSRQLKSITHVGIGYRQGIQYDF